jgi:hypothetical protein
VTAGYSGTPLLKKLGIKANSVVRIFDEPSGFRSLIDGDQTEVDWQPESTSCDVILVFAEWESQLSNHLEPAIPSLRPNAGLWIAWPKRASKVPTDLNEDRLRDILLPQGLVDNKVCAIDEKWSGLRFVWRLENRKHLPTSA